jgi:hypothetical protein
LSQKRCLPRSKAGIIILLYSKPINDNKVVVLLQMASGFFSCIVIKEMAKLKISISLNQNEIIDTMIIKIKLPKGRNCDV